MDKPGNTEYIGGYAEVDYNYMKLARLLINSGGTHMLGTHNLTKIAELNREFKGMHERIWLGYLYYLKDYYMLQLQKHKERSGFYIIPQI